MSLQKIDVDWDIYRMIENERRGFDEPQYVALRRLLKLPELAPVSAAASEPAPASSLGVPWVEDGVQVPHGARARMSYLRNTQHYEGQFLGGKLVVGSVGYSTLSAAANAVAVTKDGSRTQLNGWNYWEAQFPGETKWRSLKDMRDRVRPRVFR